MTGTKRCWAYLESGWGVHVQLNSPSSHGRLSFLADSATHLAPLPLANHTAVSPSSTRTAPSESWR